MRQTRRIGGRHKELLLGCILCNDGIIGQGSRIGDPTELALLDLADKYGMRREEVEKAYPRIGEKAFDSDRKMMTTLHKSANGRVSYTKGGTEEVLKHSKYLLSRGRKAALTESSKREILNAAGQMSAEALRVLAVAMREDAAEAEERELTFVGLVGDDGSGKAGSGGGGKGISGGGCRYGHDYGRPCGYRLCDCEGIGDCRQQAGMYQRQRTG